MTISYGKVTTHGDEAREPIKTPLFPVVPHSKTNAPGHARPPITQLFSACCEKRPSLAWQRRQTRYSTVQSAGVLKRDARYLHTSLWWQRYYKMPPLSYVYKHIPYKRLKFRLRFRAPGVNYRRFSVSSHARHARGLWKSICVIAVTGGWLQGRGEFVGWLCATTFLLDKERFAAENKTIITWQKNLFCK